MTTGQESLSSPRVERPASVPAEGQIDAFDAGWQAHETGLGRETVRVLSPTHFAREWALLAWDVRQKLVEDAR